VSRAIPPVTGRFPYQRVGLPLRRARQAGNTRNAGGRLLRPIKTPADQLRGRSSRSTKSGPGTPRENNRGYSGGFGFVSLLFV